MSKKLFSHLIPQSFYCMRGGYSFDFFIKDLFASFTVAIIALPLAMAISIASGLPPERGLFTAIVAGFLISLLGGSKYQIGGPTAAFIVTVATVVSIHGYDGLVIATMMAGVILIVLGILRAGVLIAFIPYPVITGFTSGIAILIAFSQLKDFLGLEIEHLPADFLQRVSVYSDKLDTINLIALSIAVGSLAIMLFVKRFLPKFPAPMAVVVLTSFAVWAFALPVETIESQFGSIPSMLPTPSFPEISFEKIRLLLPSAITIAILAGIESLLSAVVADGMAGTRHNSNVELVSQGTANIISVIFGGISATGAIARTAANIQAGAKSVISGILHAVWLLLFMLLIAPLIIKIPLAALAAILMWVAWNMSEIKNIKSIMKAPRSDTIVLFVTLFLTVLVDLNTAILSGISLASLLFIKKMMESTRIRAFKETLEEMAGDEAGDIDALSQKTVPNDTEVYELFGPLFFGVAERLRDVLELFPAPPKVFILRMRHVPLVDAAGLLALEELSKKAKKLGTTLVLSGVKKEVYLYIRKAGLSDQIGRENICDHIDKALERAEAVLDQSAKSE